MLAAPTIGKSNTVTFSLQSPYGTNIFLPTSQASTLPTQAPWYVWMPFTPNYPKHKPGRWKWTATVQDGPTFTCEFTINPPTKEEEGELKLQGNATDAALNVVSYHWRARGGRLYSLVGKDAAHNLLYELRGVRWAVVPLPLSTADIENKISYKGRFFLGCTLYRECTIPPEYGNAWSEWKSGLNDSFVGRYSEFLLDVLPIQTPLLRAFEPPVSDLKIECFAGHWIVQDDSNYYYIYYRDGIKGQDKIAGLPPDDETLSKALSYPSWADVRLKEFQGIPAPPKPDQIRSDTINTLNNAR